MIRAAKIVKSGGTEGASDQAVSYGDPHTFAKSVQMHS
jgi:hypothetical protein